VVSQNGEMAGCGERVGAASWSQHSGRRTDANDAKAPAAWGECRNEMAAMRLLVRDAL
jgi:hypothetical protein